LFSPGAIFATLGLMGVSFAFRFYVGEFGSYDAIYGSLGAAIALLVWLFVAAWMFLLGAAIDELVRTPAAHEAAAPQR
jgi:membrane protein